MITIDINNHPITYDLADILWWLLIGLLAGALATFLTRRSRRQRSNLLFELIIGIVGSLIGGFLFNSLGLYTVTFIGKLVAATVGAIILLVIVRAFEGRRRRRR